MSLKRNFIEKRIPQRAPFLFVDEIMDHEDKKIWTQYKVTGNEFFFSGHFPGNPIMPGVILQEAAFQTGALLMSYRELEQKGIGVVSRVGEVKFKNFVRPGDLLTMEVELEEQFSQAFYMKGKTRVGDKVVMTLKFTGTLISS